MTDADRGFVIDGWLTSYRDTRDIAYVEDEHFWSTYAPVIERALKRCCVLVEEGEVRRGFIAFEPEPYETSYRGVTSTMHGYVWYVYVAQPFRGWKIARDLMTAAGIDPESRFGFAAQTRASWELRKANKITNAHYDPYRTRKPRVQRNKQNPTVENRKRDRRAP
jgi:GNAT superfamily N-acetyltransferase